MNVVLGSMMLLLTVVFLALSAKEKGSWRQKGGRWLIRWSRKREVILPEWLTVESIFQVELAVAAAGIFLLLIGSMELAEGNRRVERIRRPDYGQGIQEENLQVEWKDEQGKRQKEEVTVQIEEKQLTEGEIAEIFSWARSEIEEVMLGENTSLNKVNRPLHLIEKLQGSPVTIQWFSSRPDLIDWEGNLGENIRPEGEETVLTASIRLQNREKNESFKIQVFPEVKDGKEQVEEMVEQANADNKDGTEWMELPALLNGEILIWKRMEKGTQYGAALLALIFPVVILIHRQQQEKERKRLEQQQMQQDYPEIVTKLQLLLSTGMNLRKSVERIAKDYTMYMRREEVRKAYEILVEVCWEMDRGLGEKEAYEKLGERWELLCYRTLSTLLVQCLQKGSSGVEQMLASEARQAQQMRRQQAQILGEQASTRLLFPMILMLLVVFVILLVPAWLAFAV